MAVHWGGRGPGHLSRLAKAAGTPTPTPAPSPTPVTAQTIGLTSNTTYPPPLYVLLNETVAENDVLRIHGSANLSFSPLTINDVSTIDAAAIAGGTVSVTGLSSITSPAETYFRAYIERSGFTQSPVSNIVKHGDVTAPSFSSSASPTVNENTVNPTGTLTFTDPTDVASVIISGGADSALFSLVGLTWTLNATPDYETKTSYVVQFLATDYGGNQASQTMTLGINDVSELTPSTLSPTNKSAFLSLSGGNLTVTSDLVNVGASARIRATQSRNGKFYFEVTIGTSHSAGSTGICVFTGAVDTSGYNAAAGISLLNSSGDIYADGSFVTNVTGLAYAPADVVGVAFDSAANKIWFRKNGTWDGDPAAGTGGYGLPTSSDDFFAAAMLVPRDTGNQNVLTYNFGATSFAGSVPTGFGAYT